MWLLNRASAHPGVVLVLYVKTTQLIFCIQLQITEDTLPQERKGPELKVDHVFW